MAEKKIFKAGENIKITIKSDRKARVSQPKPREKRYGASRRLADPDEGQGQPSIIFLDTGMTWTGDLRARVIGLYPDGAGFMSYIPRSLTFGAFNTSSPEEGIFLTALDTTGINQHGNVNRSHCFSMSEIALPMFSTTPEDVYRTINRPLPIPHRGIDTLELTVKLGSRNFALTESRSDWTIRTSAERRLERADDAEMIAGLQKEVAESSAPTDSNLCFAGTDIENQRQAGTLNLWFTSKDTDQRDLWRDYGIFKPRLPQGNYSLGINPTTPGIYFEPWSLTDSTNYKIVRRFNPDGNISTYADSVEVTPEQLRVSGNTRQTKIYLFPQFWHFVCTMDFHYVDVWTNNNPPATHTLVWTDSGHINAGYMPAFSSPMVRNGWNTPGFTNSTVYDNHPSYVWSSSDGAWDPGDTSEANYLRLMMMLSGWQKRSGAADIPPSVPHTSSPGGGFTWSGALLQARANSTAVITQEGAPVGMLVGAIEFADHDDHRYFIYRKTARVANVTVYSGDYDDPGYNNSANTLLTVDSALRYATSASFSQVDDSPGVYSANRFTWQPGTLCTDDNEWGAYVLFRNQYPA